MNGIYAMGHTLPTVFFLCILCGMMRPASGGENPEYPDGLDTRVSGRRGFVMELSPLIGEYGDIRAIAPGMAGLAGCMRFAMDGDRYAPFVWTREHGLTMLAAAEHESWGTASFMSDDGNVVLGSLHSDNLPHAGLIWRRDAPDLVADNEFSLTQMNWTGLTADGRIAAGVSRWRDGFLIEDAERLVLFPGVKNFDPETWRLEPIAPRRDGTVPDDIGVNTLPLTVMSRDSNRFALRMLVTDADRREMREDFYLGGLLPGRYYRDDGVPFWPTRENRAQPGVHIRLLPAHSPDHPLPIEADAIYAGLEITHFGYNGALVLGSVLLQYPPRSAQRLANNPLRIALDADGVRMVEERFVVRWDAEGNAVLVAGDGMRALAMSDDGRTVLLADKKHTPHIWREGQGLANFADFLKIYDLVLPAPYAARMWDMVMSPDGRCFSGVLPNNGPLRRAILTCVCEDDETMIPEPPDW